jgi:TRAP-type C4-dicarboxylate transport system permease large subunit
VIGHVPIERTVRPILGYLSLLFACLLLIAFVPALSTGLQRLLGY